MTVVAGREAARPPRRSLYWRFNRFLERWLPSGLYKRVLIILIAPVVLLAIITTVIFMERHWVNVTKTLSKQVAREMAFIVAIYESSPKTEESLRQLQFFANEYLEIGLEIQRNTTLPPPPDRPFFSIVDQRLNRYVDRFAGKPFWIDTLGQSDYVDTRIEVDKGLIFRFLTREQRASASSTDFFLIAMVCSSVLLLGIAVVFLRKQIRPIIDLAEAAQNFDSGRSAPALEPRGADEVRKAAQAFVAMKERIERHAEQRTVMLAGISHDLRTILTRFKLELALIGEGPKVKALKDDVSEMQRMLEGYMAFVKGDGGEQPVELDIGKLLETVRDGAARSGAVVTAKFEPGLTAKVKPIAFRRCLGNLVSNATRFATRVEVTAARSSDYLTIIVEDDGPGIPEAERDAVFRPFVRLDHARNQDEGGTGLGLAIARDIALGHGGDISLGDSPLGGLRATVRLPFHHAPALAVSCSEPSQPGDRHMADLYEALLRPFGLKGSRQSPG
ncbi:MAG: ATP-binding protein [Parvibaculaceae bacterium]